MDGYQARAAQEPEGSDFIGWLTRADIMFLNSNGDLYGMWLPRSRMAAAAAAQHMLLHTCCAVVHCLSALSLTRPCPHVQMCWTCLMPKVQWPSMMKWMQTSSP